jgi:CrcB protein
MAHETTTPASGPHPTAPARAHHSPRAIALVAAGGLFGAAAREAVAQAVRTRPGTFPLATFVINLTGAFALGVLLEVLARAGDDRGWRRHARLLAGTGFLGAYTTYSTLAVEADLLVRGGHAAMAVLYGLASALAGPVAAAAGIAAATTTTARAMPIDPDLDDGADEAGGAATP